MTLEKSWNGQTGKLFLRKGTDPVFFIPCFCNHREHEVWLSSLFILKAGFHYRRSQSRSQKCEVLRSSENQTTKS